MLSEFLSIIALVICLFGAVSLYSCAEEFKKDVKIWRDSWQKTGIDSDLYWYMNALDWVMICKMAIVAIIIVMAFIFMYNL